ncbi:MAG: chlorophyll synthesis pathway protein BchC [Pseudomonadota bacterium]
MDTQAIILKGARDLSLGSLTLEPPAEEDVVVEIAHSSISTGTEKLFWSGEMPPFPGMGYPLVPGYEAVGEVVEAAKSTGYKAGDFVFAPGAACYREAKGLFGGASKRLVTKAARLARIDRGVDERGALLALAATARHALAGLGNTPPDLIIGHGVMGRLLARLTILAGSRPPTVWEIDPARLSGGDGYRVTTPDADERRDYTCVYDATGDSKILDQVMGRIVKGGEIVLAGFYAAPISFAFPPAFMKEARIRIAAEWDASDLSATRELIESGALSLDGLITHHAKAAEAPAAYETAFTDSACLKMCLDWRGIA